MLKITETAGLANGQQPVTTVFGPSEYMAKKDPFLGKAECRIGSIRASQIYMAWTAPSGAALASWAVLSIPNH